MASHRAHPLSPHDRERLRARHLADQATAARRTPTAPRLSTRGSAVDRGVLVAAYLLLLLYLLGGGYAVAVTLGVVPAIPGTAVATPG